MPLLTVANASCTYGNHVVLDGVTLSVEPGEKIGLIGRNGCGKTTLMRIMMGMQTPDSGTVQLSRGAVVGYLRQDPDFDADETVREAAEGAFAELHRLHGQLNCVYEEMATVGDDDAALHKLMKRQATLEAQMETAGGYVINHRIEASLHGLGFTESQMDLKTRALSGGQLSRLGLARLLLEAPDLLLLDEPTNHLDIDGRQWLERFLVEEYRGAVVVVSHDRWLLDRVAGRIIEIDRADLREYPGNYHKYVELRQQQMLTEHRTYQKQVERIRREEQFIARYKAGQRSKQAKGRESRLERFKDAELIDRPQELDVIGLQLPKAARSGQQVIMAEGIAKRYGDTVLFEDLSLSIGRGDRLGIIGPNGVGKTTLVNCLLGDLELDEGTVRIGSRLSVGYYRQLPRNLDPELSVWRYLQSVIVSLDGQTKASEQRARDLAGAFQFSGDEQDKLLGELSGGELSRTVLAGLVSAAHNLLILDEPTNHFDIPSAERLERALSVEGGYDGTLLLVTHDRALLEATCDQLLIFDGRGGLRHFPGRYSAWMRRERDDARPTAPSAKTAGRSRRSTHRAQTPKAGVSSAVSLSKLEARIEMIQGRIVGIDEQLLDPAVYTDGAKCKSLQDKRTALHAELDPLETEWSRRAEEE